MSSGAEETEKQKQLDLHFNVPTMSVPKDAESVKDVFSGEIPEISREDFIADLFSSQVAPPAPKKPSGFLDPEVRKKAYEKSLEVRRSKNYPESGFEPEDYDAMALMDKARFRPTRKMLYLLQVALSPDSGETITAWFRTAGLNVSTWYAWQKIPGFHEWWNLAYKKGAEQFQAEWLKIGLKKMHHDFKYWSEVGDKVFGFFKKIAIKEEKSPEEEDLTKELLELIKAQNKHVKEKTLDASFEILEEKIVQAKGERSYPLTDKEIADLNES